MNGNPPLMSYELRNSIGKCLARPALLVAVLLCLATTAAHANGRLPAATGLAIHPTDGQQLLLSLTYGLALSRDGGANWTWMCEQQIDGNGGDIDPAAVLTGDGTLVVMALTNGGVLVSRDDGCTFERPMGSLSRFRGVDLTLDPSRPGRVLALVLKPNELADAAAPRYRSLVTHSLDHGRTWEVLSELPVGFLGETLELAPSDPNRIYVTGSSASDALEGLVERSDDGGLSWTQTSVRLPRGSGSLYLSAIHPKDPDRLWVRVPGRGDIYGVLPAKLWLSMDGGARFDQVGETPKGGMLGFALSPDGDRIAFGGPLDGLFLAASDASEAPSKISDLVVSCLRWRSNGLYACALEPNAPFALGLAPEPTQDFVPLWHRAATCRETCMPPSSLETRCQAPWEELAPLVGAEAAVCGDSSSMPDAGIDAGAEPRTVADASDETPTPAKMPRASSSTGCAVTHLGTSRPWLLPAVLMLAVRKRRPRSSERDIR